MPYRKDIDGLRAIAVLSVILFHAGVDRLSGGFVGVDVFFVISGFLITTIISDDVAQGQFSLARFYDRRARRILPALVGMTVLSALAAPVLLPPDRSKDLFQAVFAISTFLSNVLFWIKSGYFASAAEENPLIHTWSLAVEEQFYLLFPLIMLVGLRRGRLILVLAILAAASLCLSIALTPRLPSFSFYLLPTRAWELLVGSLCALRPLRGLDRWAPVLSGLGLAMILGAIFAFDPRMPFPGHAAMLPVLGTALVLSAHAPTGPVARLLSVRPLTWIGLASYSIYLWHQPIFAFARVWNVTPLSGTAMLGLTGVAIGVGFLSWHFVEKPFRSRTPHTGLTRPVVFAASGAALGAFLMLGVVGHLTHGFKGLRPLTDSQVAYAETAQISPFRDECHNRGNTYLSPSGACVYFDLPVKVAVFGDSHTVELSYALAETLRPAGIGVKHLSFSACGPNYAPCAQWTQDALDWITASPEITHVVVSYRITEHFAKDPTGEARQALTEILSRLSAAKDVVYVMQAPELPVPIDRLIHSKFGRDPDLIPGMAAQAWADRRSAFDAWAASTDAFAAVRFFETTPYFCDQITCAAGRDGVAYYFDDDHLSPSGAQVFVPDLARLLTGSQIAQTGY